MTLKDMHPVEKTSLASLPAAPVKELLGEVQRYLGAVDAFRELGHEPHWRAEEVSELVVRVTAWLEPVSGA